MVGSRGLVVGLGAVLGVWLGFDGLRALVIGDYLTARSGPYAGKLGPWSGLVSAFGIEPRSTVMKGVHVGLGLLWLAASAGFAARWEWGWWAVLGCALASLWYLPFGTLIGLIELVLLILPAFRVGAGGPV